MVSFPYILTLTASVLSSVAAHGVVTDIFADGVNYPANEVQREVSGENPLTDRGSNDLICNTPGTSSTSSSVVVQPGSSIMFKWDWTPDQHPGPIDEYLAYCGAGADSCQDFDPTGAVWFKIAETGLIEPSTDTDGGNWASDQLKRQNNEWTISIPNGLKSGAYLLRHTIIAMHLVGQPEFYPSCTHIIVEGSGTGVPPSSALVAIPEYLSTPQATEALDFNIFDIYESFEVAGPRPITSFSSSGPSSDPTETEDGPSPTTPPAATSRPAAPKPTDDDDDDDIPFCDEGDDDPTPSPTPTPASKTRARTRVRGSKKTNAAPAAPTKASPPPTTDEPASCTGASSYNPASEEGDGEDEGVYKRDYSKRFVSGVKVVREAVKKMNGRHGKYGKRRLSERH